MAVEESIKINIQANAEEFKIVSDIINKELGKLGKNFQILEGNINQASKSVKNFESSSKGFNKGLMSISLILQDLPYGFRGIQNNIPALAQSFGILYLAVSAVTAAMTYFVLEGDKMSKGTKALFETFKTFVNGVVNDLVGALYPAFKSIVESIQYLWSMFGENIIYEFKAIWDNLLAFLKIAGNILAQAFKVVTSLIKGDWATFGESLLNIFKLAWNGIIQFLSFALKQVGNGVGAFVKIFNKDLGTTILKSVDYTANEFANKFKFAFKEVEKSAPKIDVFSLFNGKKGKTAAGAKPTLELDKSNLERLKALESYYKDDLFMRRYYALEVLKEEEKLALMEAIFNKSSVETLANIQEEYGIKRLEIEKNTQSGIQDVRKASYDYEYRELQKSLQEQERLKKETDDRNLQNSLEALKIESETRGKLLNKTNKNDTEGRIKILEDYKSKLYDLASLGGWTSDQLDKISDAIGRVDAAIEGSKPQLKTFESNWTDTTNAIFEAVNKLVEDLIFQLGENLGKALAGDKVDVLGGFGELIGSALEDVGKALIAYGVAIKAFQLAQTNPYAAIAAGFALVVAGAALKSSFSKAQTAAGGGATASFGNANSNGTAGAYLNRPGFGLLGSSPNNTTGNNMSGLSAAQDMSGNSATFVLKGQDLLLSINRTQKASNLKGQNINLVS